jgi:uncharacterized protein DUF1800
MQSTPWVNSSALLERMNFSLALAGNHLSKGVTVDWLGQLGAASVLPDIEERQIENLIMHGQVSEKTRALVLQQLATAPVAKPVATATEQQAHQAADRQASLAAGLLFGSPDFQRR